MNANKNTGIHSFNYCYEFKEYIFPLFKFMKAEHAKSMLKDGEIYLPLLSSFAIDEPSLTYDKKEGSFNFKDTYSYRGDGENAPHIPGFHFEPGSNINIQNLTVVSNDIKLPDVRIYCCSKILFSQSLNWALNDSRDTCIMITNPKKFRDCLVKQIGSECSEFNSCIYNDEKLANKDTDMRQFYWYKPTKYQNQDEVRMVISQLNKHSGIFKIPEIIDYLIEIKLDIDTDILTGKKEGTITHEIIKKDGSASATFQVNKPFGIYSPLLLSLFESMSLGFASYFDSNEFESINVTHCKADAVSGIIPMFCVNEISNINRIIVRTECLTS